MFTETFINLMDKVSKRAPKRLKDDKLKVLKQLLESLDQNPIENLWTDLKHHVQARRHTNLTPLQSGGM